MMKKNLKTNDQGVVFVTVLILIIVAMTLAISVLSLNISQVKSTENELKNIQGQLLMDGAFARLLTDQFSTTPSNTLNFTETVGDTDFTISATIDPLGSVLGGSNSVPMDVAVDF